MPSPRSWSFTGGRCSPTTQPVKVSAYRSLISFSIGAPRSNWTPSTGGAGVIDETVTTGIRPPLAPVAGARCRRALDAVHHRLDALAPEQGVDPAVEAVGRAAEGRRIRLRLQVVERRVGQVPVLTPAVEQLEAQMGVLVVTSYVDLLEATQVLEQLALDHQACARY